MMLIICIPVFVETGLSHVHKPQELYFPLAVYVGVVGFFLGFVLI